jgi:hypothetical protein
VKHGEFAKTRFHNAEGVEQNTQIIGKFNVKNDLFNTFGVVSAAFYVPAFHAGLFKFKPYRACVKLINQMTIILVKKSH